jgi:rhomboid protease GluP
MNEEPSTPPSEAPAAAPETDPSMRLVGEMLARATPRIFVTQAILALNTLVFVAMVVTGVSVMEPTVDDLLKWGADFGPSTLLEGQPWRVLTCAFVHIGLVHFAVNMWSLWVIGRFCERLYGNVTFALIYLLSAVGGSLASLAWNPLVVSAGASGALFGIDGAMLAFLYLRPSGIPPEVLKSLRNEVVRIIGINLVIGLGMEFDNAAHVGGLVTGALAGALVARDLRETEPAGVLRLARLLGVVVLLGGATFLALHRVDTNPVVSSTRFTQEAYTALGAGDYARTVEVTTQGLERVPTSAPLYSLRGYAQQMLERKDLALADYAKALELDPKEANALLHRCRLGSQDATIEGALEDCTKFLSVDESRAVYALVARAGIFMRQEKLDEAVVDLDKALSLSPDMTHLYANRASVLAARGDYTRAIADLDEAVRREPEESTYHNNRAWTLLFTGRFQEALVSVNRAVELDPESAFIRGTRCWTLASLGDDKGAIEDCRKSVELNAAQSFDEGMLHWLEKRPAEALAAWEKALKQSPHERPLVEPWMERARRASSR